MRQILPLVQMRKLRDAALAAEQELARGAQDGGKVAGVLDREQDREQERERAREMARVLRKE
jgi:hypothetical protein